MPMIKQAMRQHNAPKALLPSDLEIARRHAVERANSNILNQHTSLIDPSKNW